MSQVSRRQFLVAATAMVIEPIGSEARESVKVYRIGWLTGGSPTSHAALLEAFRTGLQEHGWVEGRNIVLELRWAEGNLERLPALAADLVRQKPDVILTAANVVHLAVRKETQTIPIVMATGADPVEAGLAESLARPGGNVTGLSGFFEATPIKMLELISALVSPGARVSMLVDANTIFARPHHRGEVERTAKSVGVQLEYVEVATPQETARTLAALGKNPPSALVVLPGSMFFARATEIVKGAEAMKVPIIYPFENMVEAGGLMSYAAPLAESYYRAASYVDRILKGAWPGELPIEQPTRLALAINLKTAKALGIKMPPAILLRADRVIE
jgi:putative ABC transport system substrate-binding protein